MRTRARTNHDENVSSTKLPGNTLMDAIKDRQLVSWSDRGGASQHIGDQWALHCHAYVQGAPGVSWPIPDDRHYELLGSVRLDENAQIEREANRHHLENPDFVLIGALGDRSAQPVVQAADAKFAADRIKPSQVSEDVLRNLIEVPEQSTARSLIEEAVARLGLARPTIVPGVFLSPASTMTDILLRRVTRGRNATVDPRAVLTIDVDPGKLFAGLPMSRLIGPLARIDALPVSPRDNLISAVYYFRLACACHYFWLEANRPLLGGDRDGPVPEQGLISAEVSQRSRNAPTAIDVLYEWELDLRGTMIAREAIHDVARLPVTMREIRNRVSEAGPPDEKQAVRNVRRDLEIEFRKRLIEKTGVIYPDDPRSLDDILNDVALAVRGLRIPLRRQMDELVSGYALAPASDAADAGG